MNTSIWGPPLWKILHTVSYSPDAVVKSQLVTEFIETLQFVLPCIYCRRSFQTFLGQMQQTYGETVTATIEKGDLAKWMYDVHNLVNHKLDEQKHPGIPGRGITFECLTKRYYIRPVSFDSSDVWEVLQIFALNFPERNTSDYAEKMTAYIKFFQLVPEILDLAGCCKKLIKLLRDSAQYFAVETTTSVFNFVTILKAYFYNQKNVEAYLTDEAQVFEMCRAGQCINGSCI